MFRSPSGVVSLCAAALVCSAWTEPACAQLFGRYDPCGCQVAQPVAQTCYQTVPVTEYRQVRQTVKRPVVQTAMVDREFTEFEPVTETRTASVPHVEYQDVTEYRTVERDMGRWVTHYQQVCKPSPCEVDPRPGFIGWFNRTSYNMRSALTPSRIARREYVPNVVAETIPVTRRVAIQGTRQVAYNVTQMVPKTVTRKVAVKTVSYVDEEVTAMQPVTVMRTVPIGSRVAFAATPYGAPPSQMVLAPRPDPVGTAQAPTNPATNVPRTAGGPAPYSRNTQPNPAPVPSTPIPRQQPTTPNAIERFERRPAAAPAGNATPNNAFDDFRDVPTRSSSSYRLPARMLNTPTVSRERSADQALVADNETTPPSVVRVNRWVARKDTSDDSATPRTRLLLTETSR